MNDDNRNDSFDAAEEDLTEYIGKDENSKSLVLPKQQMPRRMYVLPVSNRPFFPAQVQPIVVNQNPWQETLKRVGETDHKVLGIQRNLQIGRQHPRKVNAQNQFAVAMEEIVGRMKTRWCVFVFSNGSLQQFRESLIIAALAHQQFIQRLC